eukprot:6207838-Pleurochrysis_carterae.AAC.2
MIFIAISIPAHHSPTPIQTSRTMVLQQKSPRLVRRSASVVSAENEGGAANGVSDRLHKAAIKTQRAAKRRADDQSGRPAQRQKASASDAKAGVQVWVRAEDTSSAPASRNRTAGKGLASKDTKREQSTALAVPEVSKLQTTLSDVEEQAAQLRAQLQASQDDNEALTTDVEQLQEARNEAENQLMAATTARAELERRLQAEAAEALRLSKQTAEQQAQLEQLQAAIKQIEEEVKSQRARAEHVEMALQQKEAELSLLASRNLAQEELRRQMHETIQARAHLLARGRDACAQVQKHTALL